MAKPEKIRPELHSLLSQQKLPEDIILELPQDSQLPEDQLHFLVYIPWDEKYLRYVPSEFKDFFEFVLPHLHARTTDVHTAISLSYLDELLSKFKGAKINRRVVALALILHDCGWSQLSEAEIAASLGVSGLKLNETALGPKEKHAVVGAGIARRLLSEFNFDPELTPDEIELICQAVLYHDKPEAVAGAEQPMPIEVQLLVDLDHLWSFIYDDFWLDTVRKGVAPEEYVQNLENDLDSYFVTDEGKELAKKLLDERKKEVRKLLS